MHRVVTGRLAQVRIVSDTAERLVERRRGDRQRLDVVASDDLGCLRGAARAVELPGQVALGLWPQANVLRLPELPVVGAVPGLQQLVDDLQPLVEATARLVLVYREALVLAAAESSSYAAHDVPVRAEQRVEHVHVLRNADRVVPGQDHHVGTEVDVAGHAGEVGQ